MGGQHNTHIANATGREISATLECNGSQVFSGTIPPRSYHCVPTDDGKVRLTASCDGLTHKGEEEDSDRSFIVTFDEEDRLTILLTKYGNIWVPEGSNKTVWEEEAAEETCIYCEMCDESDDSATSEPCKCYIQTEDIPKHLVNAAVQSAVARGAEETADGIRRPKRRYVYRDLSEAEFEGVLKQKGMLHPEASNPRKARKVARTGEKWITEAIEHARQYKKQGPGREVTVEIELPESGYQADVKGDAIGQAGSKARQPSSGRPHNVTNTELIHNHPEGKVNVGLKGVENVDKFNQHVISVKKIDPDGLMSQTKALRFLRRNKFKSTMATLGIVGVIVDGATMTLALVEDIGDDGKIGRQSITTFANIAGGVAGGIGGGKVGGAIGAAIGSLLGGPGVGTAVGATIGSLIGAFLGSLLAEGVTNFVFDVCHLSPDHDGHGTDNKATVSDAQ